MGSDIGSDTGRDAVGRSVMGIVDWQHCKVARHWSMGMADTVSADNVGMAGAGVITGLPFTTANDTARGATTNAENANMLEMLVLRR